MKVSVSIELIMQLSWQETIASQFDEVEPEHLLEGILKFAELPHDTLQVIAPKEQAAELLEVEIDNVRKELASRSIDSRRMRRALRTRLGKGSATKSDGQLHRTPASRMLFDAAGKLAEVRGEDHLTANHLLEAILAKPTPLMKGILDQMTATRPQNRVATPVLDRYGQPLGEPGTKGETRPKEGGGAACRALLSALSNGGSVILVGSAASTEAVMSVAAQRIANGDCPTGLKPRRLIDIRQPGLPDLLGMGAGGTYARAFAEAEAASDLILVSSVETADLSEPLAGVLSALRQKLEAQTVQCVILMQPREYQMLVTIDRKWKRLAHAIWVQETGMVAIPAEL